MFKPQELTLPEKLAKAKDYLGTRHVLHPLYVAEAHRHSPRYKSSDTLKQIAEKAYKEGRL